MWSLGVLIGGPVAAVFLLASVAALLLSVRAYHRDQAMDWLDGPGLGLGLGIAGIVLVLGISAIAYYPYSHDYHYWSTKTGVVAEVNKRVISHDSGIEQRFVVRFTGSTQEYACDDTRCSLVQKGDRLELSCKRAWQYAGRDGWDCNYIATRKGPNA